MAAYAGNSRDGEGGCVMPLPFLPSVAPGRGWRYVLPEEHRCRIDGHQIIRTNRAAERPPLFLRGEASADRAKR